MIRLILAATLGASYGIYGPPFELCENRPREQGSEEYLDSEKYQIRTFDLQAPGNLGELITRINGLRRDNPALQSDWSLVFHRTDNDQFLVYSKVSEDRTNLILVAVNLDYRFTHHGWTDLNLDALGIAPDEKYQVHDLLTDARYVWRGRHNYLELNPHALPAHIFRVGRYLRTENNFDYFT